MWTFSMPTRISPCYTIRKIYIIASNDTGNQNNVVQHQSIIHLSRLILCTHNSPPKIAGKTRYPIRVLALLNYVICDPSHQNDFLGYISHQPSILGLAQPIITILLWS